MIEELFHLHRLLDEINQELNILSDFQRSSACSALLIMVRRVSCGLQLATVPELQVDYNGDGNLDDGSHARVIGPLLPCQLKSANFY